MPIPQTGKMPIPQTGKMPIPQTGKMPIPQTGKMPIPQTGKMPIPRVEWASCPPQKIAEQARCLFHRIFSLFPVPCSLLPAP
ncbi:MAG: hypothetical protein F6J94_22105 [Moorea sp. SIO1F2]|uniref:hypothetical protein n=1 Tax=Moorena sp. SIO1F2 TaxID=2607819 RepID=UPI0013B90F8D|nr:hypothetical protein [Moorena sp. SIO1F2]NET84513.1 hypothetical protein [Moorena sp. SIO1F2]